MSDIYACSHCSTIRSKLMYTTISAGDPHDGCPAGAGRFHQLNPIRSPTLVRDYRVLAYSGNDSMSLARRLVNTEEQRDQLVGLVADIYQAITDEIRPAFQATGRLDDRDLDLMNRMEKVLGRKE